MKYALVAIGTRGDVEPFLAIGELLQSNGHQVVGIFPSQFRKITEDSGISFLPLDSRFIEMIDGELGKMVLGGTSNKWKRFKAFFKLWQESVKVNRILFKEQYDYLKSEAPDIIIHSLKATVPLAYNRLHQTPTILLSPIPCVVHPIKNKSSIGFRGKDLGRFLNKLSYKFMTYASIKNLRVLMKKVMSFNLKQKPLEHIYLSEKALYTVSPNLINTEGLDDHVHFIGYQERNKVQHWSPSRELIAFLDRHSELLFITFGSMSNLDPIGNTQKILRVLKKLKIPAIINTAAGGLTKPEGLKEENIFFTESIPYDFILPKAKAIVHHGGSGTTHLGVKYGCPTLIIPHIIDQFFWGNTLHKLGLGPKEISIRKLKEKELESSIHDLWYNTSYYQKASELSEKMKNEDFERKLLDELISVKPQS